jgi:hypothetical protein
MVHVHTRFDLREPPFGTSGFGEVYQTFLKLVDWADRVGYTPSLFPSTMVTKRGGRRRQSRLQLPALARAR